MATSQVSIRCFGGVALERDGVPIAGRATQRRRLALLLILSGANRQPVSRDRLTAYLWPESDAESARHLLSGAIYELRRVLGEETILSRGDDVWLDTDIAQCDVASFEAAIEDGNPDDAIALYRGPFADGFHVSDAPEFERWIEEKRNHYRRAFRLALETSATRLSAAGDPRGAAEAWLRSAAEDPADARVILAAMRALDSAGNRAAALKQASGYSAFVRAEFGTEPAADVVAFADSLRNTGPAPPAQMRRSVRARISGSLAHSLSSGRAFWTAGVAASLVLALLVGRFAGREGVASPEDARAAPVVRVLVLPFTSRGGAAAGLGAEFADLLGAAVEGAGALRAVRADSAHQLMHAHEAAERLNAQVYVTGTIHEGAGMVRAQAEWHRTDGAAPPVGVAAEALTDKPLVLADTIAMHLLAAWLSTPADRLSRAAARSTRSLPAFKAFLAGERDRQSGRFALAAESFARAVKADSTFALAHYRLGMMTLAADLPWAEAVTAEDNARRHESSLANRDRLLFRGYRAFRRGDAENAEQIYVSLLATYPDDLEASRQLAETFFHYNALRARPIAQARSAFEHVLSMEPGDWDAQWHMAQLDAIVGRTAEARARFDRLLSLAPAPRQSLELRALQAILARDARAEAALLPELRRSDEFLLHQIVWRSAVYLRDLEAAERIARLLTESSRPLYAQLVGHRNLTALHLAQGRWRAAAAEQRAFTSGPPGWREEALLFRAVASAFAVPQRPRAELAALRDSLRAMQPATPVHSDARQTLVGLLNVALRDSAAAATTLAQLERTAASEPTLVPQSSVVLSDIPYNPGTTFSMRAAIVRAALAQSRGDHETMLAEAQRAFSTSWFGFALTNIEQARSMERFAYAEALRGAGQHRRAIDAYASFAEHAPHDLVFLGPSHLRRAELYERLGERERAAEQYARLVDLWRNCDPELRPVREAAHLRLKALRAKEERRD